MSGYMEWVQLAQIGLNGRT